VKNADLSRNSARTALALMRRSLSKPTIILIARNKEYRVKDFNEGIKVASESIDSGRALDELKKLVEFTKAERRYLRNIDFSSTRVL